MSASKAVVIEPNGERRHIEVDGLSDLQAAVGGGYIEHVPIRDFPNVIAYVNEEGKFTQPANETATALARGSIQPTDFIAGPMLLTGIDHTTGDTADLNPLDWAEILVRLEA